MQSMVIKPPNKLKTPAASNYSNPTTPITPGNQVRDFILMIAPSHVLATDHPDVNGLFNGSGIANTWNSLANGIFKALNVPPNIEYIDMPNLFRNQYQYYTKATIANWNKLAAQCLNIARRCIADYMQQVSQ